MKRYDIIALLLVIYLAVMAYFGRGYAFERKLLGIF